MALRVKLNVKGGFDTLVIQFYGKGHRKWVTNPTRFKTDFSKPQATITEPGKQPIFHH
jgi:hypothetical protein